MNRHSTFSQFAVRFARVLRTLQRHRQFGGKAAVQAACFQVGLRVRGNRQQDRAVGGLRHRAVFVLQMKEFQVHIAVGGVCMHRASTVVDLDVAVHGAQILYRFDAGDAQCAIHRAQVLDVRTARHAELVGVAGKSVPRVIHMKNATVHQILDRIVDTYMNDAGSGHNVWIYRECRVGGETFAEVRVL